MHNPILIPAAWAVVAVAVAAKCWRLAGRFRKKTTARQELSSAAVRADLERIWHLD